MLRRFVIMTAATLLLWVTDICVGAVDISPADVWSALFGGDVDEAARKIVVDIRLTRAVVALLAGGALAVSGLQMQTIFRNPLAGPYVMGISSGASLGVAILMMTAAPAGMAVALSGIGIAGAAWIGAAAVLLVIALLARRIRDIMVILIIGMMLSSGISAVVQIMQYLSDDSSLKAFVVWSMGALGDVTGPRLAVMAPAVIAGLILAVLTIKPLNMLLFGEEYAVTMGLRTGRARILIFASTSLLAGSVTAFCGPIGFIGLAMPHVARLITADSDHRVMLPASLLVGASSLLLCDIVARQLALPVNAIAALLGIPVIIWVVLKNR